MKIEIIDNEDQKISPGNSFLSNAIRRDTDTCPDRESFRLMPGKSDLSNIEGKPCIITGKEYIIGRRRYNLSGYGLKGIVTPEFTVIPELRKSFGKEIKVLKDKDGNGICGRWPVIELITKRFGENNG